MGYFYIQDQKLVSSAQPPVGALPLLQRTQMLPPLIGTLHENFQAWGRQGLSPGPVIPGRIWIHEAGIPIFYFAGRKEPQSFYQLYQTSLGPDLAAWLVLLDKWMETYVVVARARMVWSVEELAGALRFCSPPYLPPELLAQPPDNWARTAYALALAVADGPLSGSASKGGTTTPAVTQPANRHWQPS